MGKSAFQDSTLPREAVVAFEDFLKYHSPKEVSRNLRRMLTDYLGRDSAIESNYFHDLIADLEGLFELLDAVEDCGIHRATEDA